uniref:Uncharacterized protein n=1 Tax=Phage sp. ct4bw6 TaxID=2826747 RepID=A0A8S5MUC0_9VIRU|nr:MAG TPA: hypothetical protein [Phage sp. ct4bw6]
MRMAAAMRRPASAARRWRLRRLWGRGTFVPVGAVRRAARPRVGSGSVLTRGKAAPAAVLARRSRRACSASHCPVEKVAVGRSACRALLMAQVYDDIRGGCKSGRGRGGPDRVPVQGLRPDLRGAVDRDRGHLLPRLDDVTRVRDQEAAANEAVAAGHIAHGERAGHQSDSGLVSCHNADEVGRRPSGRGQGRVYVRHGSGLLSAVGVGDEVRERYGQGVLAPNAAAPLGERGHVPAAVAGHGPERDLPGAVAVQGVPHGDEDVRPRHHQLEVGLTGGEAAEALDGLLFLQGVGNPLVVQVAGDLAAERSGRLAGVVCVEHGSS